MIKPDETKRRDRRDFLKAAGGMAIALAAAKNAAAQAPNAKAAARANNRRNGPTDRALWITWYDLPDSGREDYFAWLHQTYLPNLLNRPGYLWAAHYATRTSGGSSQIHHTEDLKVPTGFHYILLIGVMDALVLGNPAPSAINAALPEQGRKMLAMRTGERVNLMTEAGRCEGHGSVTYKEGMTGAPYIQIGSFNCPVEYEEEMHAGYVQQRLPAMCETASCIRTRELNSVAGWAKHGILYEFASQEGFERDYEAANAKSPLGTNGHSVVPMLVHAPGGPNSALRIWPPISKA